MRHRAFLVSSLGKSAVCNKPGWHRSLITALRRGYDNGNSILIDRLTSGFGNTTTSARLRAGAGIEPDRAGGAGRSDCRSGRRGDGRRRRPAALSLVPPRARRAAVGTVAARSGAGNFGAARRRTSSSALPGQLIVALAAGARDRSDRSQCAPWRPHVAPRQHYRCRGDSVVERGRRLGRPRSRLHPIGRAASPRVSAMAFRLRRADLRILVGCGAAGGIAGAFGAPLAGAFYGFELIIGGYSPSSLAPVAVSRVARLPRRACVGAGRGRRRRAGSDDDRRRTIWSSRQVSVSCCRARHHPDARRRTCARPCLCASKLRPRCAP